MPPQCEAENIRDAIGLPGEGRKHSTEEKMVGVEQPVAQMGQLIRRRKTTYRGKSPTRTIRTVVVRLEGFDHATSTEGADQ